MHVHAMRSSKSYKGSVLRAGSIVPRDPPHEEVIAYEVNIEFIFSLLL